MRRRKMRWWTVGGSASGKHSGNRQWGFRLPHPVVRAKPVEVPPAEHKELFQGYVRVLDDFRILGGLLVDIAGKLAGRCRHQIKGFHWKPSAHFFATNG